MTPNTIQKQKLATFTYIGKETRTITRLLKDTNIRIAYKTENTMQNHLQPRKHETDKHNKSGIYQMKCKGCQQRYIGQTGINFKTRYKEHIQAMRSNKPNSRYSQHILDTQHTYGTMEDTMNSTYRKERPTIEHTGTLPYM
jgi:hypothetical protein